MFQYIPAVNAQSSERNPSYYDVFNCWLGQILQRDIENVPIELCEIEQHGVAIRICCLESAGVPPTIDDVENVVACLEQQIVSF